MKIYPIVLIAALMLGLSACNHDPSREFLPGTYTNFAGGEFSKAEDTLVIEAGESNTFLIHRKTGFNLITEGKVGKRQYETEEWNAVYDEATKTLTETKKGKLISIYPTSGYILVGKRKYIKK